VQLVNGLVRKPWTVLISLPARKRYTDRVNNIVCDWWHGLPQLFYVTPGHAGEVAFLAPTSCSVVDLQMVLPDEEGQDGGRMGDER
jgi:hypothetical protein